MRNRPYRSISAFAIQKLRELRIGSLTGISSNQKRHPDLLGGDVRYSRIMIGLITLVVGVNIGTGCTFETIAQTSGAIKINRATLHHKDGSTEAFSSVKMFDDGAHEDDYPGDGIFGAEMPSYPSSNLIEYMFTFQTIVPLAQETSGPDPVVNLDLPHDQIVINEFMASNSTTIQDGEGEFEDWIELLNVSGETKDLSGTYLTDKESDPKQWMFPEGTTLAPGEHLIVWADKDVSDETGFHANFKLSKEGETIQLIDTDANGNNLIDLVIFGKQNTDVSFGRYPDGSDFWLVLFDPTPGSTNLPGRQLDYRDTAGARVWIMDPNDGTPLIEDFGDFISFAASYGLSEGEVGFLPAADTDGNGTVEFADFLNFAGAFNSVAVSVNDNSPASTKP